MSLLVYVLIFILDTTVTPTVSNTSIITMKTNQACDSDRVLLRGSIMRGSNNSTSVSVLMIIRPPDHQEYHC